MNTIRVSKAFDFEMSHALWNYDGACRNIHGHSYKLQVTLCGKPEVDENDPKSGMVLDFAMLKKIVKGPVVDHLDHALVLNEKAKDLIPGSDHQMFEKIHFVDFQPTCENLVLYIVNLIKPLLPLDIRLHSLRLYETATSFAEWYASDNPEVE